MTGQKKSLFVFFILALVSLPASLHADFKLSDSIQKFGERRYVRPYYHSLPVRGVPHLQTSQYPLASRMKIGPINVHPIFQVKIDYDDNILLEADDPREDLVFNISPGVILDLPINQHQIAIGYEADIEVFTKHSRQNDQNQHVFVLVDLHFPSWYVNVLDKFTETSDRSGTTFSGRIPRYDHTINPKIGYRWNRLIFEAGFRHFLRDFRQQVNDSLDFQLVEWSGVVYYDLFARLKTLLEYQVAQTDYDDDFTRNGTFQQVRVGLEGEVAPNIFVDLKTGIQFRNYETDSKPNFNGWVGSLTVDYQMRENLAFRLQLSRDPVEATFQRVNFYIQHVINFGMSYEFWPRWTFFSSNLWKRHDYQERTLVSGRFGFRRDDHLILRSGLRYDMLEWMDLEVAYEYLRRDSNFARFDYTDRTVSFTSRLAY